MVAQEAGSRESEHSKPAKKEGALALTARMRAAKRTPAAFPALLLPALACLQCGCQREEESLRTPPLAEATANDIKFSSYEPKNPFHKVDAHRLERTLFEAPGPQGLRVEVRDLFIAPGTKAENVSLPGPAMLQVLDGAGSIAIGNHTQELKSGTSISLPQETSCVLESSGISPLVVRAHIFVP